VKHKAGMSSSWLPFAAACGFIVGLLVIAALFTTFPSRPIARADRPVEAPSKLEGRTGPQTTPTPVATVGQAVVATLAIGTDPLEDLRKRHLDVPVQGVHREALRSSFDEHRGSVRKHEAIDILAPRHTPAVAVEDGTIARLFLSKPGGITVYQFDPTVTYVYYYAHLDRYAKGLKEGAPVKRGQVLGYVGTSGNAPKETPHLHFAILKLTEKKRWWQGTAIDPYTVLK
jgi:murein DD-endopeptidase MepM/ murein hydrolase activator NlpD